MNAKTLKMGNDKQLAHIEATISKMLWGTGIWPLSWALEFDAQCAKQYKVKSKAAPEQKENGL